VLEQIQRKVRDARFRGTVNDREMARLRRIGWDGGEKAFRATLRDQILLPSRREYYPDPDYLIFGQSLRGWRERALR
jgi:hypothetical protein